MSALLNLVGMKNEINGSLLTIMLAVERVKKTQTDRQTGVKEGKCIRTLICLAIKFDFSFFLFSRS